MPQYEFQCNATDQDGKPASPGLGLVHLGPLIQVEVRVPAALAAALEKAGKEIPAPQVGLALIDTGATRTSIDRAIICRLGLPENGRTRMGHADGAVETTTHAVELGFPAMGSSARVSIPQAIACDLSGVRVGNFRIVALFGRDLLQRFVMIYNGPQGRVNLIFV